MNVEEEVRDRSALSESRGRQVVSQARRHVYDFHNRPYAPECIYYYHSHLSDNKEVIIDGAYYYDYGEPIGARTLKRLIKKLARNHRENIDMPPKAGNSFKSFKWRRISFIVVLLDNAEIRLKTKNKDYGALEILEEKGNSNFSLFNGEDLEITLPTKDGPRTVTAVACINYMEDEDGDRLDDDESRYYELRIRADVPGLQPGREGEGGTNMGPPIGPP